MDNRNHQEEKRVYSFTVWETNGDGPPTPVFESFQNNPTPCERFAERHNASKFNHNRYYITKHYEKGGKIITKDYTPGEFEEEKIQHVFD